MHNITCLDIVAVRHWFQPTEMEIPIRYTYVCVYIYIQLMVQTVVSNRYHHVITLLMCFFKQLHCMKGTFKIRWTQLNQQLYLGQHLAVGWEAPNQQPWMPWIPVSRINSSHRLDFSPWSKGVFGALGSDFAESKLSMKPDPCGWFLATSRWLLFSVNK